MESILRTPLVKRGKLRLILQTMEKSQQSINVLAYQEGEAWVAQCVEYDIYARAPTLPELPDYLGRAIAVNVCINSEFGRIGLNGIPAAPQKIQDAFKRAKMQIIDGIGDAMAPSTGITIGEMKVADRL
jgi:hypothetical protein